MNSLPDVVRSSQIAAFADDTKAFKEITSTHDAEQLQEDLSGQVTWTDSVSLNFTYSKCKAQRITRKLKPTSLGNTLILIALHKVTSIYPPTKLLFRCLAVTDLLVGLISQPRYVTILFPRFTTWNVNVAITRRADEFFFSLLLVVSLLTSAAISVDRLLALLLGLTYRHTVTLRRVWVVIVCFWLISALQATGSIIFEYPKLPEIAFWVFCALLTLSLLVSVFSYAKIFKTLRYRQVQVHRNTQQGQPNGRGNQLNIARYKKTVYSIAWVQLALLICYIPYNLLGFLRLFDKLNNSTEIYILGESFVTLVYLNSSLNPALYCWRIRDVKQEVKNTIRKIFCYF